MLLSRSQCLQDMIDTCFGPQRDQDCICLNVSIFPEFCGTQGRYVEVKGGEKALMEALYLKGPMTVSVDAAPHSFAYYESGIYTEQTCRSKLDKLDHAVIVSG